MLVQDKLIARIYGVLMQDLVYPCKLFHHALVDARNYLLV